MRNIGANKYQRGATRWAQPTWACQARLAHLVGCGLLGPPPVTIFWYISGFDLEKIRIILSGWSATISKRNLDKRTFAFRQSDSAWGTSLPEGEIIIIIIITNNSPILGRAISINIFNSTNFSQTLVYPLCSIFVPEL